MIPAQFAGVSVTHHVQNSVENSHIQNQPWNIQKPGINRTRGVFKA